MAIYKKRGVYWYNFWWNGVHVQKSSNQGSAKVARQMESAHKTRLAKGEMGLHDPKPVPTFKQAMEEFLEWAKAEHPNHPATAERYRVSSVSLLKYFKERMLDQIAPEDIEKFKAYRRRQKNPQTKTYIKSSTINRDLACLKALYSYHIRCDVRVDNPVKKVKFLEEEQEMYVLSYHEQNIYLDKCSQTFRDVAVIMLETGMRPDEVFRVQTKYIHLDKGYLYNPYGKTKAARRKVVLNQKAREVIKNRLKDVVKLGSPWLFPSPKDPRKHVVKLNNAHYGALRRSKLKFRLYDLRHTWAHARRRVRDRPRDAGGHAGPLENQHGVAIRPPDGAASEERGGTAGAVQLGEGDGGVEGERGGGYYRFYYHGSRLRELKVCKLLKRKEGGGRNRTDE